MRGKGIGHMPYQAGRQAGRQIIVVLKVWSSASSISISRKLAGNIPCQMFIQTS